MFFHLFRQTCILALSIYEHKSRIIVDIKRGSLFPLSFYQRLKTMQNSFLIFIIPPGSISSFIYNQSEFGACISDRVYGGGRRCSCRQPAGQGHQWKGAPQKEPTRRAHRLSDTEEGRLKDHAQPLTRPSGSVGEDRDFMYF